MLQIKFRKFSHDLGLTLSFSTIYALTQHDFFIQMGQEEVYEILNVLEFNRLVTQVLACR